MLCATVAAAPAVAFAATDDEDNSSTETVNQPQNSVHPKQLRRDAKVKLDVARERAEREERKERKRERERRLAKQQAAAAPAAATGSTATPGHLQAIAACESGGDPSAIGGGGAYRGKYQFDYATWASVGGSGDPAAAPEAEQDQRAAMLYARSGSAPWPVCGS
jgi:hypothetical protein